MYSECNAGSTNVRLSMVKQISEIKDLHDFANSPNGGCRSWIYAHFSKNQAHKLSLDTTVVFKHSKRWHFLCGQVAIFFSDNQKSAGGGEKSI